MKQSNNTFGVHLQIIIPFGIYPCNTPSEHTQKGTSNDSTEEMLTADSALIMMLNSVIELVFPRGATHIKKEIYIDKSLNTKNT